MATPAIPMWRQPRADVLAILLLGAIGKVVRHREAAVKPAAKPPTTCSAQLCPPSVWMTSSAFRVHGGADNGLHWALDVTMSEDQARNRKDHGPQNIALLRRLVLNLAKFEGSKGSMKGKLERAGWNDMPSSPGSAAFIGDSPEAGINQSRWVRAWFDPDTHTG
jgi:hypothetical protein